MATLQELATLQQSVTQLLFDTNRANPTYNEAIGTTAPVNSTLGMYFTEGFWHYQFRLNEAGRAVWMRLPVVPVLLESITRLERTVDVITQRATDLTLKVTTQAELVSKLAQLLALVVGGETVAASVSELFTLLKANTAADTTTALGLTDVLAQLAAVRTTANNAATSVQLARGVADQALALGQTQATTLSDQGQKIAANASEILKRLYRDGDTATKSIMMPMAKEAAAALRLDQTYGGLNSPARYAFKVGALAQEMAPGPLTDPSPQGRVAKPYLVQATMTTPPTLGVSVTLRVGTTLVNGVVGTELYTKTYLLTGLPLLNNLLNDVPKSLPTLVAGTRLYAQVVNNVPGNSPGEWIIEVFSYYH